MNPGQQMFYSFFVERAMDDKKGEAKALLEDCFAKQDAGTFSREYFEEVVPKFYAVVKPEMIDEVRAAMDNFSSRL